MNELIVPGIIIVFILGLLWAIENKATEQKHPLPKVRRTNNASVKRRERVSRPLGTTYSTFSRKTVVTPPRIDPEDIPDKGELPDVGEADRADMLLGCIVDAMLSTSEKHLLEKQ